MTKRQALRAGVLTVFAMVLGKYDSVSAKEGMGLLTVDLNQWRFIRFKHGTQVVDVSVASIFNAIKEGVSNGRS